PGALAAQSVGRQRRRQRLDVQRQIELAGRTKQRFQPAASDLTRIAGDSERARPAGTDAGLAPLELERRRTEQRRSAGAVRGLTAAFQHPRTTPSSVAP